MIAHKNHTGHTVLRVEAKRSKTGAERFLGVDYGLQGGAHLPYGGDTHLKESRRRALRGRYLIQHAGRMLTVSGVFSAAIRVQEFNEGTILYRRQASVISSQYIYIFASQCSC